MNKSLVRLTPNVSINYNQLNNELIIESQEKKPLTINYIGNIQLKVEGDIEISSNGQFDVVTHKNMICLESLGSSIHFNSFMAKSIRELKVEEEEIIKRPESILTILNDKIQKLEDRIDYLENSDCEENTPCQE
jgi:predicted ribosome quality control (RQC) complex YloA/Tae2 family protein